MDEQLITPDMSIEEVLDCWPDSIHFFIEQRMACVGCCLSTFDTLEDALKVYGLPRENILDLLNGMAEGSEISKMG